MEGTIVGETAALMASILWTFTSLCFTFASKRIGPLAVNLLRLMFAVGLLWISHILLYGQIVPVANNAQWGYLGASGIIGLAIGDLGYFGSLVILRPRKATLLMAVNPIFSSTLGFLWLGEVLSPWAVAGIGVTMGGVLLVIFEKDEKKPNGPAVPANGEASTQDTEQSRNRYENGWLSPHMKWLGVLFGLIGSAGQGIGLVMSKYGMRNAATDAAAPLEPLSAALIRMLAAGVFFLIVMILIRKMGDVKKAFDDRRGMQATVAGTMIGPFLGVWVSMMAVTYAVAGVAATLMSLMPVFIIPVMWFLYRERTGYRGIAGAAVAITGVAMLFLL